MAARALRSLVDRLSLEISLLKVTVRALREDVQVARKHERWARQEADRHEKCCDEAVRAMWVMHAVLGFPPIKDGELYQDVIVRELVRLKQSDIDWKMILRGDNIAVARAVTMLDPATPQADKEKLLKEEEHRQNTLPTKQRIVRWMRKQMRGA